MNKALKVTHAVLSRIVHLLHLAFWFFIGMFLATFIPTWVAWLIIGVGVMAYVLAPLFNHRREVESSTLNS